MKYMQTKIVYQERNSRSERILTLMICAFISISFITYIVNVVLDNNMVSEGKYVIAIVYGLLFLGIAYLLPLIIKRIKLLDLVFLLGILFFWLLSLMTIDSYCEYFFTIGKEIIINVVPCYIICRCVRNYELTRNYLAVIAILITVSGLVLMFILDDSISGNYSQYVSYQILPAVIISANEFMREKKPIHLINSITAVFLIFAAGARGPLVCIFMFIILKAIIALKESLKNIALLVCSTLLLFLVVKQYYYNILNSLRDIMLQYTLSVRTIDKLLANDFLQDSARNSIANYAWDTIMQHPFLGVGLAKDRIIISKLMGQTVSGGWYPHNLFLELYMQFGIILGSVAAIAIIAIILRAIFRTTNNDAQDVACLFVTIGVFPLFFSGSYLTSPLFFCAIAICLNVGESLNFKKLHNIAIYKKTAYKME